MKICKNGDFRHKFYSKIGVGHVLGIPNTHLCAKNQKKTNDEISRKYQKKGFSSISFRHTWFLYMQSTPWQKPANLTPVFFMTPCYCRMHQASMSFRRWSKNKALFSNPGSKSFLLYTIRVNSGNNLHTNCLFG